MYGQGPHKNAGENLYGHYYVSRNEWQSEYAGTAGLRGLNLRGSYCVLDYQQTDPDLRYKSVHLGPGANYNGATAQHNLVVGILDQDMVMGEDKLVDTWVRLLIVGYTDRVLVKTGESDAHNMLYVPTAVSDGQAQLLDGETVWGNTRNIRLTGIATIDTSVNPALMDFTGVDTATVTWGATDKPGVDRSATTGVTVAGASVAIPPTGYRPVGWRTKSQGDLKLITEVTEGRVYRLDGTAFVNPPDMTPAYVNCLQSFKGWI